MPKTTSKRTSRRSRRPAAAGVAAAAAGPANAVAALYLPIDEAARIAGVTRSFMEREIEQGRLPAIRDVGLKVHRADLEAWRGQPVAEAKTTTRVRAARAGATPA